MKLMKTLFTYSVKQTNLKNRPYISTESPKVLNDALFQHFVSELEHCN